MSSPIFKSVAKIEVIPVCAAAILAAAKVPDPIFDASVVSVVADDASAVPFTVIASASNVPSISASPLTSREPASSSPVNVMFLNDDTSLFESTVTTLLATTVPTDAPVSL